MAVLVEIGPILAGLLVAGRMGAGLAAELGSMVLNEEIDARIVLGADPVPTLVAPRAIACALAVPLLTVIIDASALLGSLAAELAAGKSTIPLFWSKALVFLRLSDVVPATLKTAVFGLLVGLLACWTGLNADRSTEAVGRAAIRGRRPGDPGRLRRQRRDGPLIQVRSEAMGWNTMIRRCSSVARGGDNDDEATSGDGGRWPTRGLPWRCWRWRVSGCTRWPAGTGGCSRRFGCEPSSRRSAAWRSGTGSGFQGIDAGVVERIVPPAEPGQPVELVLRIDERLRHLVRTDAVARIVSEGLVGAKVVELTPGRPDAPALAELDTIASERPIEIDRPAQEGSLLAGSARRRHPGRRAGAGRVQRDRRLDSPRRRQPGQAGSRRGGLSKPRRSRASRRAKLDGPGGEPDGPEADLAAVAVLRPPGLSRPRARAVPAGRPAA